MRFLLEVKWVREFTSQLCQAASYQISTFLNNHTDIMYTNQAWAGVIDFNGMIKLSKTSVVSSIMGEWWSAKT